ncbi:hypothetical protein YASMINEVIRUS_1350 [Yasminevirus sp. GU-2018]|uniref:Uncharacterized protein n=1 Tax=Yasminevirus sp. GU-2018 TaxID=2420051 RepID=A0A5K0U9X3_9VIRU|nr:hypothetical protein YASMINEVIRUS_1350 [Yasminevirus sp. GU-2018]
MPSNNGLKVCTFNAKYDHVDYNCCAKKTCDKKCGAPTEIPDSLFAALIAIQILPSNADIYNIQNVKNKCIVEHLLKEIARVKDIMEEVRACDPCSIPVVECLEENRVSQINWQFTARSREAHFRQIACHLNEFPYLCDDAVSVKDALSCCGLCGMDYVEIEKVKRCQEEWQNTRCGTVGPFEKDVMKYARAEEYNAYYNGTCLTLVKKSLCIVPETKDIPCVDSLVLFFETNGQRFINVNVNLGCLVNEFEDVGCKKAKADSIVCFLKKYEDCGAVIMTGAFGEFDYDTPQLFFRGDAQIPEIAQKVLADGLKNNPVPSDFPCDLHNPLYEVLEFLLRNCKSEHIPYSWLLQYLRLQNCKKCNLYKLVPKCDKRGKSCGSGCKKDCCSSRASLSDARKPSEPVDHSLNAGMSRAQLRQLRNRSDKKQNFSNDKHDRHDDHHEEKKGGCCGSKKDDRCDKPACVSAKKCCCGPKCETKCEDNCRVQLKKCDCDDSKCEIRCKEPFVCKCDDSKHKVHVDTCKDLCKKGKSCCDSCKEGGHCEGEDACDDGCDDFKYCDPLTVLKRELCLYNTLNNIPDVNDRFTGYHDHYNRCLDCKFPRGMFQAWAQCQDYERPCKKSRVIDNNSELMALDHFLVSDCIKNNIAYACLSDICITRCDVDVKKIIAEGANNALDEVPYGGDIFDASTKKAVTDMTKYVFQYSGSVVKSFFTHRMYCVNFDFPHMTKGCKVECGETLHGLGLTGLWQSLCKPGCDTVSIKVFEKFGLDKHPYFRDFFWDCLKRHACYSAAGSSGKFDPTELLLKHASCDDNSVICIQKRHDICEEEFYKHLLCILSNSDSRDRFIVTIAFMECLYKSEKLSGVLPAEIIAAINNPVAIKTLFTILSVCFKERLNAVQFLEGFDGASVAQLIEEDFGPGAIVAVGGLIDALEYCLRHNCIFMEVLLRYASRTLDMVSGKACGNAMNIPCMKAGGVTLVPVQGFDNQSAILTALIAKVKCGSDVRKCLLELFDDFNTGIISALLFFINGFCTDLNPSK